MLTQILILVILILINAYFAATEIAFISLNDAKIEKDAKEGKKKAKQIIEYWTWFLNRMLILIIVFSWRISRSWYISKLILFIVFII